MTISRKCDSLQHHQTFDIMEINHILTANALNPKNIDKVESPILKMQLKLTCSKSVETLEKGMKICSKLTIKTAERCQYQ